jgi:integrase/recombinase XerD
MPLSIQSYINELKARRLHQKSIQGYERLLKTLATRKPLENYTKADLVAYFNDHKGAESSRNHEMRMAKKYFKDTGKPEVIEWIKCAPVKETLRSDDILTPDDVNKLIESTDNHYTRALIAFLFETGCRISEAMKLNFKDFQDTDQGMIVNIPTTKTAAGYRKVILPLSTQYIHNLKAYTAARNEDKVFRLCYSQNLRIIENLAVQAGITKPVTCHKFRHAQATDLVKRGYNEAIIRKKLGWTPTSDMIARYQHLNDEDVINATLENTGKLPQTAAPRTEIKEADKLTLVDAAMQFSKLSEENQELKDQSNKQDEDIKELQQQLSESNKNYEQIISFLMENSILKDLPVLTFSKKPTDAVK